MNMIRRGSPALRFGVAAILVCVWLGPAAAQPDPNLPPTFGSVKLQSGFPNDPFAKPLVAGGQLKTNLGGVNAHVAKAPDFSLHYTKGKFPLTFAVKSAGDTTLLINLPDGTWIADDDSGGGLDPMIRIAKPQSGRYDIYVGTFQKELVAATLYITELDLTKKPQPPPTGPLPDCYIVSAGVDNYPFVNKLKGDLNDARNTVAAFKNQAGMVFRHVKENTLLDSAATHQAILQGFKDFATKGSASDFMVLFLSGHGGRANGNKSWYYCPYDFHPKKFADTALTDKQILDASDALVKQKKNVVIIIDACFCGQLHATAQPYLDQYKNANEGGMILMLSSAADQTSTALGNFSAFAKSFADGMAGAADVKKDGKITLADLKSYTQQRTAQLLIDSRLTNKQDTMVAWSPSISKDLPFASVGKPILAAVKPTPAGTPTTWTGNENLAGYGKLIFKTYPNGIATMTDAKTTIEGVWQQQKNHITLSFANGAIVYTGTLEGNTLSGTATSPGSREQGIRSWTWSVTK